MVEYSGFTDAQIWEFVDGAADAELTRAILAVERTDPAFAEQVRTMREMNSDIASALDHGLSPAPDHLSAKIISSVEDQRASQPFPYRTWAAIAATVALAVALGSIIGEVRFNDRLAKLEADDHVKRLFVEQLMQDTLENRRSSEVESAELRSANFAARIMPTATYKSTSGHWCRAFEEVIGGDETAVKRMAVACRIDGVWRRMKTTTEGYNDAPKI